jgi:hypothetical protein
MGQDLTGLSSRPGLSFGFSITNNSPNSGSVTLLILKLYLFYRAEAKKMAPGEFPGAITQFNLEQVISIRS